MSHISEFLVDTTGPNAGYHLDGLEAAQKMVYSLRYRGLEPRIKVWDEEQGDYVVSEVLTQEAKQRADDVHNNRPMGRPSQGRSYRLQANITPDQARWLESQKQPEDKSISDVVFRMIEQVKQESKSKQHK